MLFILNRVPELPADTGGQQHDGEHCDLYGGLLTEAAGVHDGLLLALLGQGDHRPVGQGQLLPGHQRGQAGLQDSY